MILPKIDKSQFLPGELMQNYAHHIEGNEHGT